MVEATGPGMWRRRLVVPARWTEPLWVFIVYPQPLTQADDEYRDQRRTELERCCVAAKAVCPEAAEIVGLAITSKDSVGASEDVMYLDTRTWTPEMLEVAKEEQCQSGYFDNPRMLEIDVDQYPQANVVGTIRDFGHMRRKPQSSSESGS